MAALFIDLDNFKFINDSLGHNAGDELLKTIAKRMVDCVRATDTVVRLGGDEFVVVLFDQPKDADVISETVQKIRSAIAEPVRLEGHDLRVTSSLECSVARLVVLLSSTNPGFRSGARMAPLRNLESRRCCSRRRILRASRILPACCGFAVPVPAGGLIRALEGPTDIDQAKALFRGGLPVDKI